MTGPYVENWLWTLCDECDDPSTNFTIVGDHGSLLMTCDCGMEVAVLSEEGFVRDLRDLIERTRPSNFEFACMIHRANEDPWLGGVGPTEHLREAETDVAAWTRDGYVARLVRRPIGEWEEVTE